MLGLEKGGGYSEIEMTQYHGSGRASLENAVERALRRTYKAKEIKRYFDWKRHHIRDPETYSAAVEDRRRLGLAKPQQKGPAEAMLSRFSGRSRRVVSMPGAKAKEVDARTEAEGRAILAIEEAVAKLRFHVEELGGIPNPHSRYVNRVSQRLLLDAVHHIEKGLLKAYWVGVEGE